jgi:formamidopyrimidine-DNA glycosylase
MVIKPASSRLKPVLLALRAVSGVGCDVDCGTGFSRESVGCHTAILMVIKPASSRLKPVLLASRAVSGVGCDADLWDRL